MALVKCRKCGNLVSDKADSCSICGYPVSIEEDIIKKMCPECGNSSDNEGDICPHCGYTNNSQEVNQSEFVELSSVNVKLDESQQEQIPQSITDIEKTSPKRNGATIIGL